MRTIQRWDHGLPEGQDEAQWGAKQEEVRNLEVKLPQSPALKHGAAARAPGAWVVAQHTGV